MARDLVLQPDERLIWSSPRGPSLLFGSAGSFVHAGARSPRALMGMFVVTAYVVIMVIRATLTVGPFGPCVAVVLLVALGVWWRRTASRPAFYLSDQHLFCRRRLGGVDVHELALLRRCERYLERVRTRSGGIIETPTDAVMLYFEGRPTVRVGTVKDFEGLWDLLHHGVLARAVQLTALPSLDGAPAPAEKREDLLFVRSTRTGGEVYGPLFVGPTRLIRFTEPLPCLLEGTLLTLLASSQSAAEIEPQLAHLVRHPKAGHSLVVELSAAPITVEGTTLRVERQEREEEIELSARDAERATRFVAGTRGAARAS